MFTEAITDINPTQRSAGISITMMKKVNSILNESVSLRRYTTSSTNVRESRSIVNFAVMNGVL
jgi:hypothetical protein